MYDELPQTQMHLRPSANVKRAKKKKHKGLSFVLILTFCMVLGAGVVTYLNYTHRLGETWQAIEQAWQSIADLFRS